MTYLGHIIRIGELLIMDPVTVRCLKDSQPPTKQSKLPSFLGLCNFYRRFVENFSDTAAPLNVLLRKDAPPKFDFLPDASLATFETLRIAVTSPPILALPIPGLPYTVDLSDYQVRWALFQSLPDGELRPLGFWRRTLINAERNYSTSEKCLAVVWDLQTLRQYLAFEHFTVFSDDAALHWLLNI